MIRNSEPTGLNFVEQRKEAVKSAGGETGQVSGQRVDLFSGFPVWDVTQQPAAGPLRHTAMSHPH